MSEPKIRDIESGLAPEPPRSAFTGGGGGGDDIARLENRINDIDKRLHDIDKRTVKIEERLNHMPTKLWLITAMGMVGGLLLVLFRLLASITVSLG